MGVMIRDKEGIRNVDTFGTVTWLQRRKRASTFEHSLVVLFWFCVLAVFAYQIATTEVQQPRVVILYGI